MIVNTYPKGWEIIHQRAHGLLAMKIASHWQSAQRPERWVETLVAIAEHDDGQEDWQGTNHLNEAGAPLNFSFKPLPMTQLRRITELAQHKGRWVALLISTHVSSLHEPMRGENAELTRFLDEQQAQQRKWRTQLSVRVKTIREAYALMRWCDQLSLILCRNEIPADQRILEIYPGPDGTRHHLLLREDGKLTVRPWPFEETQFTLSVEATYLEQLRFENDRELWQAITKGNIQEKTWELVKE